MPQARLQRVLSRVRSAQVADGGFDRTHDGVISGWFNCPACLAPPTLTPDLRIQGHPIVASKATTSRPDVPGGLGFLLRFNPTGITGAHISVHCPVHIDQSLDLDVSGDAWTTPALGAIETSTWPLITGWLTHLTAREGDITLVIDGYDPVPVRSSISRPDVQAFLGTQGVGGFQIDLGALFGYALPDSTRVGIQIGDSLIAEATISDSPLGDDVAGCLSAPGGTPLDNDEIHALRRRLRDTEIDTSNNDWREILDHLGLREFSAETEQWANHLTHHGQTPQQAAAWLALRDTHALGVPALNPLPAILDAGIEFDESLPERVFSWTEPILGIHDRPSSFAESRNQPTAAAAMKLTDMKVAVAGLVHHRSGLGQNVQNSLKALDLASIHACAAPFFPARGGWNANLAPSHETLRSLEDHTVLLHLPVDKVIPSLVAQPALLRTDRLIGYFMWELESVPKQFRRALDLVDEIWTATEFVAEAFRKVTETPVHVTGHAVDVAAAANINRSELGISDDAFVVHYSFDANSSIARKNPNAALDAFHSAFGGDPSAVFVLKIRNFQHAEWLARQGDRHAQGLIDRIHERPGIILITGEWSYRRSLGLIGLSNVFLSLHRSEGFGYGLAEALDLGVPVVCSDHRYAGGTPMDGAVYVAGEMVSVLPEEYFYWEPGMQWAATSVEAAADALCEVRASTYPSSRVTPQSDGFSLSRLASVYTKLLSGAGVR